MIVLLVIPAASGACAAIINADHVFFVFNYISVFINCNGCIILITGVIRNRTAVGSIGGTFVAVFGYCDIIHYYIFIQLDWLQFVKAVKLVIIK